MLLSRSSSDNNHHFLFFFGTKHRSVWRDSIHPSSSSSFKPSVTAAKKESQRISVHDLETRKKEKEAGPTPSLPFPFSHGRRNKPLSLSGGRPYTMLLLLLLLLHFCSRRRGPFIILRMGEEGVGPLACAWSIESELLHSNREEGAIHRSLPLGTSAYIAR